MTQTFCSLVIQMICYTFSKLFFSRNKQTFEHFPSSAYFTPHFDFFLADYVLLKTYLYRLMKAVLWYKKAFLYYKLLMYTIYLFQSNLIHSFLLLLKKRSRSGVFPAPWTVPNLTHMRITLGKGRTYLLFMFDTLNFTFAVAVLHKHSLINRSRLHCKLSCLI